MKKLLCCLLGMMLLTYTVFLTSCDELLTGDMNYETDQVTIGKSSLELKGKKYIEVQEYFNSLGFTNVKLVESEEIGSIEGSVIKIVIGGWLDSTEDFSSGDIYSADTQIKIYYVKVKEPAKINITMENNEDFKELMQITDQTNITLIQEFVNEYENEIIEFDGCVVLVMQHKNYKTRFDIALAGGDYEASRLYGPLFAFENVNFTEMNVSGCDSVEGGMNFHITAEIEGYSLDGGYIVLSPVSMVIR